MNKKVIYTLTFLLVYINNNADSIALAPQEISRVAVSIGQVSNTIKVRSINIITKPYLCLCIIKTFIRACKFGLVQSICGFMFFYVHFNK